MPARLQAKLDGEKAGGVGKERSTTNGPWPTRGQQRQLGLFSNKGGGGTRASGRASQDDEERYIFLEGLEIDEYYSSGSKLERGTSLPKEGSLQENGYLHEY